MSYCDTCIHHDVCGMEGVDDEATTYCADRIEPCEDAINRQAVLSKINEVCFSKEWVQFRVDKGSYGQRDFLINYIKQLPPVTPQLKIKGVLEQLAGEQNNLLATTKAWSDAIEKNGYVN